ncbi:MAG: DUF1593 domain-containing protein [Vicinamibacteraceae bacterium]
MLRVLTLVAACLVAASAVAFAQAPGTQGALDGVRHRVLVSTDIGGTDPDDQQSMVHLLLYADVFDLEGLVSSPYGLGRKSHILEVIDRYERDYPNLRRHSDRYPTADRLRSITKQGEIDVAPYAGIRQPTEGSRWIIERAHAADPRPLYVLVWGGLEDLAQALHDAPDILPKLRVHFIGGPNKKWSPDAYQYIATHHPRLWMIEANATYEGWFTGGDQTGDWGNTGFVKAHIAGSGALGDYFAALLGGTIKMGDTPTVARLLRGTPEDPTQPTWGGRHVRAWPRPYARFERLTTAADRIEHFAILELVLPVGDGAPARTEARLVVENQSLVGDVDGGHVRFRFSPKEAKAYTYTIRSNAPALEGRTGGITSVDPRPGIATQPAAELPFWWTDDPSPAAAEGVHLGAATVSQWRRDFLADFAARLQRIRPATTR